MPRFWIALVAAAVLGVSAQPHIAAAADYKIGIVVTQRLLAGSESGLTVFTKLKAKKEQAQEKLNSRAIELKEMEEDLQKRAMVLSVDEKKKAMADFEERQREAARLKEDLERDLQREEAEHLAEINQFLSKIIVDYGQEHGYDLILDAQVAVYFSEKFDVTDDILERADAEWKKR